MHLADFNGCCRVEVRDPFQVLQFERKLEGQLVQLPQSSLRCAAS